MRYVFALAFLLLSGCATSYQANGFGGGYTETQLSENVFVVSFRGNGYSSPERASDFAMLRSAEIAKQHGFRYFLLADSADKTTSSVISSPSNSSTSGSSYVSGNRVYGNYNTSTMGGDTYTVHRPRTTNKIICFKDRPETSAMVLEADFVIKSIRQKYAMD